MITRQRIVSYGIPTAAAATIVAAALLTPWAGGSDAKPEPQALIQTTPTTGTDIDVVFAVDTTGSMGGLLDGAKRTVWSIASHIKKTDPNANVRVGLVAYRDIGDDYVTRPFALTGDLDAVFTELSTYEASGGGDTPENVDAALDDTLHKMQWRRSAKKLVFLVGDAPPATRGDVPSFDALAQEARTAGIIINTIRCGEDPTTATAFQRIASLAHGEFSSIVQDGGVQQIATPYDAKLAELSEKIDRTSIIVGDEGARRRYRGKMAAAAAAPAPAKADRASYYAKGTGKRAADDLVGGVASGEMSVDAVPTEALPADLRDKDKATIKAEVAKRVAEREVAQQELAKLAKEREEYLEKNLKDGDGFDSKVKTSIEKQLK